MRNLAAFCLATASLCGCLPGTPSTGPVHDGGAAPRGGGVCGDRRGCPDGGVVLGGEGGGGDMAPLTCGAQTFPISSVKVAPNLFFIVDASGSMATAPDYWSSYEPSKWQGLQAALSSVVTAHRGQAQFGLSIFPSGTADNACQAGQIDVAVGAGTEPAISARIAAVSAEDVFLRQGFTPTGATMQAALANAGLKDAAHPNYVVLMTDGVPNCESQFDPVALAAPNATVSAIAALYAATPSVKTFVVGFGDVTNSAPGYLNAFADAGHTARAGTTHFYSAQNAADLESAFDSIVSGVASCDYHLDMPPDDPTLVAPTFDGQAVIANATNGFTYDAGLRTATFHGASCDLLKTGKVTKVEFVYGCPAPQVL